MANYQLKITLNSSKPPIWRRIIVSSDILLPELHAIIQIVMGWTDSHLHHFFREIPRGSFEQHKYYSPKYEFDDFWEPEMNIDYKETKLSDLLNSEANKIVYEYDFGDSWYHDVMLEKILPLDENINTPICIKGKNACAPDDCGGIWGYMAMLEVIIDPSHRDHKSLRKWLGLKKGETYDPAYFNMDEINENLRLWAEYSKKRSKIYLSKR